MKELIIQSEQTIFDIAIQEYGTADAATIFKILNDNPNIAFDYKAKLTDDVAEERIILDDYEVIESGFKDIAYPLAEGQTISIDEDYEEKDSIVLKELSGMIVSTGNSEPLNN